MNLGSSRVLSSAGFSVLTTVMATLVWLPVDAVAQGGTTRSPAIDYDLRNLATSPERPIVPWTGSERGSRSAILMLGINTETESGDRVFLALEPDGEGQAPSSLPGDIVQMVVSWWDPESGERQRVTTPARIVRSAWVRPDYDLIWEYGWVHLLDPVGAVPEGRLGTVVASDYLEISDPPENAVPAPVLASLRAAHDSLMRANLEGVAQDAPWRERHEMYYRSMGEGVQLTPAEDGSVRGIISIQGPDGPLWASALTAMNNPDDKASVLEDIVRLVDAEGRVVFEEKVGAGRLSAVLRLAPDGPGALLFSYTLLWHDSDRWRFTPPSDPAM